MLAVTVGADQITEGAREKMSATRAGSGRPIDEEPKPGRASLVLRPFGYLLIGLVWLAIWALAVSLLVGSVGYLAYVDSEDLISGVLERLANPFEAALFVLILLPILAAAVGGGGWFVITGSWPLAVLSFLYVARSLQPAYAGEKLSFTTMGARGSTLGPPTVSGVALSLQPLRATRFTDWVMRFYFAGWSVNLRMIIAMLPAGLAWVTAIGALAPSLSEMVHLVFGLLTVLLLGVSWTLCVRAFRAADPNGGPAGDRRRVTDLSAKEREQRMKELRERREDRLREG